MKKRAISLLLALCLILGIATGGAALAAEEKQTVSFVLYGDTAHGDNGEKHTLSENNLIEWIPRADYEISENSTVYDVFKEALTKAGMTWEEGLADNFISGPLYFFRQPHYISSITKDDVTLGYKTNGITSGWMFALNGSYGLYDTMYQHVEPGDCIVCYYTDNYDYDLEHSFADMKALLDQTSIGVSVGKQKSLT